MNGPLEFLSAEDARTRHAQYTPGSVILPEADQRQAPFLTRAHDRLPAELTTVVEHFKTVMLEADRALKDKALSQEEVQERVSAACQAVHDALDEHVRRAPEEESAIGAYVFRETFPFFMLSRFIDRAFTKPRGYAGDYATIEQVYNPQPAGDGRLGPFIDRWALRIPSAWAVRNRRGLLSEIMREAAARWTEPRAVPIASLASGPARELFDLLAEPNGPPLLATCIDIDPEALDYARDIARNLNATDRMVFVQENLIRLAQGRSRIRLEPQHLMYSLGLIDYLQDDVVVTLLDWIYDALLPGGTVVLGNFDRSNPSKGIQDHITEWRLIHRSEAELRDLFGRSRFAERTVEVRRDATGIQLLGLCVKTP